MAAPLDPRLVRRARATLPFLAGLCVVGVATALLILAQAWLLSRGVSSVFAAHHLDGVATVSYTHLTLPTILLV